MQKLLLAFVILLAFPITVAAASSTSALGYTVTVTDDTWMLAHEDQVIQVIQTSENEAELDAYAALIYIANDLLQSISLQATFIGLFILTLIFFCIMKPRFIFQPLTLICFILCVLFAIHIYDQLASLRIHAENLRYYFLFFST